MFSWLVGLVGCKLSTCHKNYSYRVDQVQVEVTVLVCQHLPKVLA